METRECKERALIRVSNEDPEIHSQATETTLENWLRVPCCQGWRGGSAEPRWGLLVSINKTNKQRRPNELRLRGEEGAGTRPRSARGAILAGMTFPDPTACSGGCHQHSCIPAWFGLSIPIVLPQDKVFKLCVPLGWIFHSTVSKRGHGCCAVLALGHCGSARGVPPG